MIWLQNVVVDLLLGLGFDEAFADLRRSRAGPVRRRARLHHHEPPDGCSTCWSVSGVENPIVCSNINKIGFRMCGGIDAYRTLLDQREFRAVAMSVFASGRDSRPRGDRVGLLAAEHPLDRLRRLEPANIRSTKALVDQFAG